MWNKNPLKCIQLRKKIKNVHNSYMLHTFNINIYACCVVSSGISALFARSCTQLKWMSSHKHNTDSATLVAIIAAVNWSRVDQNQNYHVWRKSSPWCVWRVRCWQKRNDWRQGVKVGHPSLFPVGETNCRRQTNCRHCSGEPSTSMLVFSRFQQVYSQNHRC